MSAGTILVESVTELILEDERLRWHPSEVDETGPLPLRRWSEALDTASLLLPRLVMARLGMFGII